MKNPRYDSHPDEVTLTPEEIERAFLNRLGQPSKDVGELAAMRSDMALLRLIQLMYSGNHCVAVAATKAVLAVLKAQSKSSGEDDEKNQAIQVVIQRFAEGNDSGEVRNHELPMVYGGWQGPRDLDVPCGPGVRPLRRQRKSACKQPPVSDGPTADVSRSSAEARPAGELAAAATQRIPKARKAKGK